MNLLPLQQPISVSRIQLARRIAGGSNVSSGWSHLNNQIITLKRISIEPFQGDRQEKEATRLEVETF